ncbi:hypothetical protein EB796_003049 [Bugula neritina]|uniref:Uncharacterized protein n=1 Tax=Bugula neritina TaxID=10212 RepID=A0A7J7KLN8_BUGNE|nr:hypothetical protein EB796_003049 [Bugula neritina]
MFISEKSERTGNFIRIFCSRFCPFVPSQLVKSRDCVDQCQPITFLLVSGALYCLACQGHNIVYTQKAPYLTLCV